MALYFQGQTERTYAREHGLSQKAVNKRRKSPFEMKKDFMENIC